MSESDEFNSEVLDGTRVANQRGRTTINAQGIGSRVQLYKRIKNKLDDKSQIGHNFRVNVGNKIVDITPTWENENISPGTLAGAIVAAISTTIDDFAPVDIASSAEIAGSEPIEGGARYTVNVDGVLPQQARFMAMIDAGTGFTSLITDEFSVNSAEPLRKRVGRTTWQFEVEVRDTSRFTEPLGPEPLGLRSRRQD